MFLEQLLRPHQDTIRQVVAARKQTQELLQCGLSQRRMGGNDSYQDVDVLVVGAPVLIWPAGNERLQTI